MKQAPKTEENQTNSAIPQRTQSSTLFEVLVDSDESEQIVGNHVSGEVDETLEMDTVSENSFVDVDVIGDDDDEADESEFIQHLRETDEVDQVSHENELLARVTEIEDISEFAAEDMEINAFPMSEWDWEMTLEDRWRRIRGAMKAWDTLSVKAHQAIKIRFDHTKRLLHDERTRVRTKTYEGRAVIGGTITGCVSRLEAIRATKPFAILVEEASEVLEPLLFSCLTSTTCKLEMVGDHMQLQPSIMSKFDFERVNRINISLFERLIRAPLGNEVPFSVLSIQRRMRKNIADLTRDLYLSITTIEDHSVCTTKTIQVPSINIHPVRPRWFDMHRPSVSLPMERLKRCEGQGREVPGVSPHLFFWTHSGVEERAKIGLSRINRREADMVCKLAKYLVVCGVPSTSIAILTPYKGQLMLLRGTLMSPDLNLIQRGRDGKPSPSCVLSTVDRFQGDEADVVIISLVIDGKSKTPFVKLQNRMIVLLSRARIGMYIIGNERYFADAPEHWRSTLTRLQHRGVSDSATGVDQSLTGAHSGPRIGNELPLCCPRHRSSTFRATSGSSLKLNFCQVPCDEVLDCEHPCGLPCHWADADKHRTRCQVPVNSPCSRHRKQLKCIDVTKATKVVTITQALESYQCPVLVEVELPCSHMRKIPCFEERSIRQGRRQWPVCIEEAITPFVYDDCRHSLKCSCVDFHKYATTAAPDCIEYVDYVPRCGHMKPVKCYVHKLLMSNKRTFTCQVLVPLTLPRCGHPASVLCSVAEALLSWTGAIPTTHGVVEEGVNYGTKDHPCSHQVTFRRLCGHEQTMKCGQAFDMARNSTRCSESVVIVNPECGHIQTVSCTDAMRINKLHDSSLPSIQAVTLVKQSDSSPFRRLGVRIACKELVTFVRNCGHEDKIVCHEARDPRSSCSVIVERVRPDCGHPCMITCALTGELDAWHPWAKVQEPDQKQLMDQGIVLESIGPPLPLHSSRLLEALKLCSNTLLFRRDRSCGHDIRLSCQQVKKILGGEATPPECSKRGVQILPCGHNVDAECNTKLQTIKCKEVVTVPCTNSSVCQKNVKTLCWSKTGLVHCDSKVEWRCSNGAHSFQLPLCSRGAPVQCPKCSYEALVHEITATENLINAGVDSSIPWPPGDASISFVPGATQVSMDREDMIDFYHRKLIVLNKFRRWIDKTKDPWDRALFQPRLIPVFALRDTKGSGLTEVRRFEVKDFASTRTWNTIQVFEFCRRNASVLTATKRQSQVVFGFLFTLGLNLDPLDAPNGTFGNRHVKWINGQQNGLGYDSAVFQRKGPSELEMIRVWEPFTLFPTSIIPLSELRTVGASTESTMPQHSVLRSNEGRFITYHVANTNSSPHLDKLVPQLPAKLLKQMQQIFKALPFDWTNEIQLIHPWPGYPLLLGRKVFPESVLRRIQDKLSFTKSADVSTSIKSSPFAGINALRNVNQRQPFDEFHLFSALEQLCIDKINFEEARVSIEAYVKRSQSQRTLCHPLVILAFARLVARMKAPPVQPTELFDLFMQLYPDAGPTWIASDECDLDAATTKNTTSLPSKDGLTAREKWNNLKETHGCSSDAMEELLDMVGLNVVKRFAVNMFKSAFAFQSMTANQRMKNAPSMNYCFTGNPGTGKTTVAKMFARVLHDSGMRWNSNAELCTAQELKDGTPQDFRDRIQRAMGGVVFIDEAYELDPKGDPKGRPIVAELLVAAEEYRHDLSVIIAGYEDDIQKKLYAHNEGLRSRFIEVPFDDFDEADLLVIWKGLLRDLEWTNDDNAGIIACRRLSRGAGQKGFGNARAVRQFFKRATSEAMAREDFNGVMHIRTNDVVGERPTLNPKLQQILEELDQKIGWTRIKQRVRELIDVCDANYERELNGVDVVQVQLNRLFLGNPGTGKTTCASIYGRILKCLGFLSIGDVVKKTAADFVGQYIGQSQTKTTEILLQAKGKVLIIDEAYNLDDNWFGKQVLDVIVEKIHGSETDDIAVLLIGYEHQMNEMLRTQNPGLARRFPMEYAFYFDDYSDRELYEILSAWCAKKKVVCPLDVSEAIIRQLAMQRNQSNFGNAGAVEGMLKSAMANATKRSSGIDLEIKLTLQDIENELLKRSNTCSDPGSPTEDDPLDLLNGLYRMDAIRSDLTRLRNRIKVAQDEGEETPEIGHFVFRGSPGTGKTTVARVMGKIFHRMGLLGSDKVVETSGLNMTGEYLGQTKKRVEEQLGQAKGAILFIDEAYELGKGMYGEEAMTSLVAAMTDTRFKGMVIIIAGYPADLDAMMNRNAGLKSRFTRFLDFLDWDTSDCLDFMLGRSNVDGYQLTPDAIAHLTDTFDQLRQYPGFGNGRDVDKIWKALLEARAQRVTKHPELERTITLEDAISTRQTAVGNRKPPKAAPLCRPTPTPGSPSGEMPVESSLPPPPTQEETQECNLTLEDAVEDSLDDCAETTAEPQTYNGGEMWAGLERDAGVSDEVWAELERAKLAHAELLRKMQEDEDARRKLEVMEAIQDKIRRLALCPMGYEWLQVGGGWRCAGGSHFVSDEQLQRDFTH